MNSKTHGPLHFSYQCVPCSLNSLIKTYDQGIIPVEKQGEAMRAVLEYLRKLKFNQPPILVVREMHRILKKLLKDPDPYREIKAQSNRAMIGVYADFKSAVGKAHDSFQMALRLAVLGNEMDFSPHGSFDSESILKEARDMTFPLDESEPLRSALSESGTLLYLGDNAGEIVADRIFLETIGHPRAYFAVRGSPIMNDATMEDALQAGMDRVATVISSGDDSPGILLEYSSSEFQDIFHGADLIIAKGQGNFSGLLPAEKNIYFLFRIKCDHVAALLKARRGDFVVVKR